MNNDILASSNERSIELSFLPGTHLILKTQPDPQVFQFQGSVNPALEYGAGGKGEDPMSGKESVSPRS